MSETKNTPRPLPQTSRTRAPLSSARSIFARSNTLETRFRSLAKVTEPSYGGVFDKVQRFFKTKSDEQLEKVQKSNIDTVTVISGLVDNQNNLIKQITDELKNDDEFNPEEFFRRLRGGPISGKRRDAARVKARERLARQRAAKASKGLGTIGKTINRAMTAVGVGLGAAEEFNRSRDVGRAALVGGGILGGMLAGGAIGGFAGPLGSIAGSIVGGIIGEDRTRAAIESIINPSAEALERGRAAIQQGAGGPMVQQQVSRGNLTEELRELVRTNVITRNQANELNRGLLSGVSVEQTRQRLEQIKTENRRRQQQSSIEGLATLASFNDDTYNDAIPVDENIIDVLMQTEFQELNFEADKIEFDGKLSVKQDASSITMPTATAMGGSYITPISTGAVGGFSGGTQSPSVDSGAGQQMQTGGTIIQQTSPYQQGDERQGGMPQAATPMERPGVTQGMGQVGSGNAQEAFNFFVSRGWTREQAAGIVGNLSVETGGTFDPNAFNAAENAYGIAQWRGSRRTDFERWLGRPIVGSTFQQQLEFIQYELTQGNERNAGNRLRQAGTVVEATEIVDRYYERSSGAAIQRRINDANAILSGSGLAAAGTDMVAGDQAQRRTGQQIIMIPGQPGAGQAQQTIIPNQTHRGEVPLRIRFERQVA